MLTLRIEKAELKDNSIVIKKLVVFDKSTGEVKRIAEINEQLLKLFTLLEIDISKFMQVQKLMEKNPDLKLLVDAFDLAMFHEI